MVDSFRGGQSDAYPTDAAVIVAAVAGGNKKLGLHTKPEFFINKK